MEENSPVTTEPSDVIRLAVERTHALPAHDQYVLPPIDWEGLEACRPRPLAVPSAGASGPLPRADVVIMTWTVAEWAALAHVFCNYDRQMSVSDAYEKSWRAGWENYSRNYYQIRQYMEDVRSTNQGHTPSVRDEAWGQYRLVEVNGLRVLLLKSAMHLAQDGAQLPLLQFTRAVCDEAKPHLVLSIGTAGGVRREDALGSALITNQAYFHLLGTFRNAEFNGTTVSSSWQPVQSFLDDARERLIQVSGFDLIPVSPQYPDGSVIRPDRPDSRIKVVTESPIITTDMFLFGTTENGLEKYGCIVEMDDAVVGLACAEKGVEFGFVRNVSDPVINAALPENLQEAWAVYIYKERGLFTSYNGALAAWALVAGESER